VTVTSSCSVCEGVSAGSGGGTYTSAGISTSEEVTSALSGIEDPTDFPTDGVSTSAALS